MNGTNFLNAGDGIEVTEADFIKGIRNFSYNVTFNVSTSQYDDFGVTDAIRDDSPDSMKGTDYVTIEN